MTIIVGDCREVLATLEPDSIDAIVTDPPYALSFMSKTWDSFSGHHIDPAFLHWLAGFVDGEGCFSVHKKTSTGYKTYDCQFSISLRADDRPILERIHRTLGIGTLSKPTAHRTGTDNPKARYSVSAKAELVVLRDIFRAYPLRAKKARDFELWSDALDLWLKHEPGEWAEMAAARSRLMASREYVEEGVRIDPFQVWCWGWAREALRVLKPGGHLIAFGGTRTYHRLASGLEDAGFEIRDQLAWLFGSGFPKSLNVGEGRGTGLKPAHEPIALARKPLVGTVAANVAGYGTGALNIDACRIGFRDEADERESKDKNRHADFGSGPRKNQVFNEDKRARGEHGNYDAEGRWPANVVLDEEAAAMLDAQTGPSVSRIGNPRASAAPGDGWGMTATGAEYDDQGGPSRFFYCAKTSRAERNAGLEPSLFEEQIADPYAQHRGRRMVDQSHISGNPPATGRNNHPTVKPIALMRWLTRLVTPPGGIILDPFAGSGTTGCACALEGFEFLGVELDPEYVRIAEARIAFWTEHGEDALRIVADSERSQAEREVIAESGQLDLLG